MFFKMLPMALIVLVSCNTKTLSETQFRASTNPLGLVEVSRVHAKVDDDPYIGGRNFLSYADGFSVADPFYLKKALVFHADGSFSQSVGQKGEGPGEYAIASALAKMGDTYYLYSGSDRKLNMYDSQGHFVGRELHNFEGIVNNITPIHGRLYAMTVSRYSKHLLHVLNEKGELIDQMIETPDDVIPFDTFSPQGGLIATQNRFGVFLNYRYKIDWYDFEGNFIETSSLVSLNYTEPDFKSAKTIKGHEAEKAFRQSFSQFNGIFAYQKGFVTQLLCWNEQKQEYKLEFWTADFQGLGQVTLAEDFRFMGVVHDRLLFLDSQHELPDFVFMKTDLKGVSN